MWKLTLKPKGIYYANNGWAQLGAWCARKFGWGHCHPSVVEFSHMLFNKIIGSLQFTNVHPKHFVKKRASF